MNENKKYIIVTLIFILLIFFSIMLLSFANKRDREIKPISIENLYTEQINNKYYIIAENSENEPQNKECEEEQSLTEEEKGYLLKLAMAEAEGESIYCKELVIRTVINRVESEKFPNTIKKVIEQKRVSKNKTVYQFSVMIPNGRFYTTEPNEECYIALENVLENESDFDGMYFEACQGISEWHSNNLEFILQESNTRFYK